MEFAEHGDLAKYMEENKISYLNEELLLTLSLIFIYNDKKILNFIFFLMYYSLKVTEIACALEYCHGNFLTIFK